eukprot:CAMPEP_0195064882 /NCGR_PEP_ID=MMETSP0448-20130528/10724_1 /TAXON_ID=66468 /ORGANISM="Heterocapsa triquestra, Strain CCMP 448" /LENGTH=174 /DNA_ID=CAMNT_0040095927 /DNA_START=50 /DNA_END=572 /DNA_ORIENTATION=-
MTECGTCRTAAGTFDLPQLKASLDGRSGPAKYRQLQAVMALHGLAVDRSGPPPAAPSAGALSPGAGAAPAGEGKQQEADPRAAEGAKTATGRQVCTARLAGGIDRGVSLNLALAALCRDSQSDLAVSTAWCVCHGAAATGLSGRSDLRRYGRMARSIKTCEPSQHRKSGLNEHG